MLVWLSRSAKKSEEAVVQVAGRTLRVYGGTYNKLEKSTDYPSEQAARDALEALVAKREKAGWTICDRLVESPWLAWVDEVERQYTRVVADIETAKLPYTASFQRTTPSRIDPDRAARVGDVAQLARVASILRIRWTVGDAALQFRVGFEVNALGVGLDGTQIWRHESNGREVASGVWRRGKIHSELDDDKTLVHDVAAFRAWFPRWVRDDVMGFIIAELAR